MTADASDENKLFLGESSLKWGSLRKNNGNLSVHIHFECIYGHMFNIRHKKVPVSDMKSEENG